SLIVGFPGETDREFKELFKFVREQRFERLGVFKYSREEGTPAFGYQNQIPEKVKQARFDDLMRLQQEISLEFNQGFLGKETEVLIDEKESEGVYLGRMGIDAPDVDGSVYVRAAKSLKPGDFVKVKITDIYEYDLAGEL
ncbi:MAG TPA: TRAM domain-containing protein, partial [Candidatus Omnitrophota bacterium]|nr:TRAM domain-containing protein [Candidatus Omnitrophota bacterium]